MISARSSAGTRRAFSQSRRATRTRLASSDSYGRPSVCRGRLIDQPAELVGDETLVPNPRQRRLLLAAGLRPARGHLRPLVPVQKRLRAAEVADLGEERPQLIELGLHAGNLPGRARRPMRTCCAV